MDDNIEGQKYSFSSGDDDGVMMMREQDRLLPIANVGRIMKQILPPNAKISKEAKETMQECVSEFIGFVTGEASEKCRREKRKTLNGDDVCWALGSLGFDDYAPPVRTYLHRYRQVEREKAGEHKAAGNNGGRKGLAEEPAAGDDNYLKGEPAVVRYSSSETTTVCHNSFQLHHQFH
ncbi:PREDICTED: nuclear transcription factor Y subunit B-5 [Ipomoea nil]|uniref:nuclear transcription factor Y subunit B-5 n=1 Tax=Ipomoea nil TaxID=35883 RepID=UPI000900CAED|nr:PREDICTED: nuclear transcription factor Y subunit B-5 [Ipomoea nil]